jgi:hypothetical protein
VLVSGVHGDFVREVHCNADGTAPQYLEQHGTLDVASGALHWIEAAREETAVAPWDVHSARTADHRITVSLGSDHGSPATTLLYQLDEQPLRRVRYPQVMFVEYLRSDPADLAEGASYHGAVATQSDFLTASRRAGRVTRAWDFDSPSEATSPLVNYPATNTPYADWYESMLTAAGAIE